MPIPKPLHCSLAGTLALTFSLLSSSLFTAVAQRQTTPLRRYPLLDNATCSHNTSSGSGSYASVGRPFERRDMSPIISNQLRESSFHIRAGAGKFTTLVCNIDTSDFETLTLQMGLEDASSDRELKLTVEVMQGGSVIQNPPNLQPGGIINSVVDLKDMTHGNPGSVAIKLSCEKKERNVGCIVYFLEAELSPSGDFLSQGQDLSLSEEGVIVSQPNGERTGISFENPVVQGIADDITSALRDL